jgi:hypothetical protein
MPIKVKIGSKTDDDSKIPIELNMRRSLDGNYMIFDHDDIDIVVMPEEKKILTLPKELITDQVYGAQNRMFSFLKKKGVIDLGSVQGGNVYGSMEANMLEVDGSIEYVLLNISKFIDEERPYFNFLKSHEELEDQHLTEPDNEHSTELGDVDHSSQKGSLQPEYMRDVYGLHGIVQGY